MVISFPRPPFSNPNIEPEDYDPSVFDISSITKGEVTLVQTSIDHNYVIGQIVRFIIPKNFGIRQLNGKAGIVIAIPADDQVEVEINSLKFDDFVSGTGTPAQIKAIGDVNSGISTVSNAKDIQTFIPGSFINVSP